MPYVLGVDVGSGRVAATLCRRSGAHWAESEPLALGETEPTCSSTLFLDGAGYVLLGAEAEQRASGEPARAVRDVAAGVGDGVGVPLGEQTWPAEELTAAAIGSVLGRAAEDEGEAPERVGITHPPGWGPHRRGALQDALRGQGHDAVVLVPRPAAVAERLAALTRIEPAATVAVCSLGAHRSAAAVLRRNDHGAFDLLGDVAGADDVAGERLDDLLVAHVLAQAGDSLGTLDPEVPAHRAALRRLRADCERAKRELSAGTEATVPVTVGDDVTMLRVTRAEFERLAAPVLDATFDTVRRACAQAAEHPVITGLAGGSAAIPLLARRAAERCDGRIVVEARPELTAAAGAALVARRTAAGLQRGPASEQHTALIPAQAPAPAAVAGFPEPAARRAAGERPAPPPMELPRLELPDRRLLARLSSTLHPGVLSALVVAVIAAGVVLTFVLHSGGSGHPAHRPLRGNRAAPTATSTAPPHPATGAPAPGGNGP